MIGNAERLAFVASPAPMAQEALVLCTAEYGNVPPSEADVIVPLGGDGFMLESMHRYMDLGIPLFGMHRGTIGFLMNTFAVDGLRGRLANAEAQTLHPLQMQAELADGDFTPAIAFNEVSLLRQERQAAKLRLIINGRVRMEQLICDGVIISTAAGSTAYNLSAHGPIIPIGSSLLALTPISPFRPRRWRGALLPSSVRVRIEIIERAKRPVSATADHIEVRDIVAVEIEEATSTVNMLFDAGHNLQERILAEQFGIFRAT